MQVPELCLSCRMAFQPFDRAPHMIGEAKEIDVGCRRNGQRPHERPPRFGGSALGDRDVRDSQPGPAPNPVGPERRLRERGEDRRASS